MVGGLIYDSSQKSGFLDTVCLLLGMPSPSVPSILPLTLPEGEGSLVIVVRVAPREVHASSEGTPDKHGKKARRERMKILQREVVGPGGT